MQCLIWKKWKLNLFQILTCTYSLRKVQGVSYISNRYRKANNKHLKSYDPNQKSKHIIYLDANNLYVYAMSTFLPISGLKWMDPKELILNKYTSNSSKGCVLEVGLEYPKEWREFHND